MKKSEEKHIRNSLHNLVLESLTACMVVQKKKTAKKRAKKCAACTFKVVFFLLIRPTVICRRRLTLHDIIFGLTTNYKYDNESYAFRLAKSTSVPDPDLEIRGGPVI